MTWIVIIIIAVTLFVFLTKKNPPKTNASGAKTPAPARSPDGKNSQDTQPVVVQKKSEKQGDHILDPSSARIIDLPQLPKPDYEAERKPQEYWNTFNKGVDYYNRGWYTKAKAEFLKLCDYKEPHQTYSNYLLRTYRKITGKAIEKQKLLDAYEAYEEFFKVCEHLITDTDRRNYNKLIDKLLQKKPDAGYQKIEIRKREKEPDFVIVELNNFTIRLLSEVKADKDSRPQKNDVELLRGNGRRNCICEGLLQ